MNTKTKIMLVSIVTLFSFKSAILCAVEFENARTLALDCQSKEPIKFSTTIPYMFQNLRIDQVVEVGEPVTIFHDSWFSIWKEATEAVYYVGKTIDIRPARPARWEKQRGDTPAILQDFAAAVVNSISDNSIEIESRRFLFSITFKFDKHSITIIDKENSNMSYGMSCDLESNDKDTKDALDKILEYQSLYETGDPMQENAQGDKRRWRPEIHAKYMSGIKMFAPLRYLFIKGVPSQYATEVLERVLSFQLKQDTPPLLRDNNLIALSYMFFLKNNMNEQVEKFKEDVLQNLNSNWQKRQKQNPQKNPSIVWPLSAFKSYNGLSQKREEVYQRYRYSTPQSYIRLQGVDDSYYGDLYWKLVRQTLKP